jgi:hypothetical protein
MKVKVIKDTVIKRHPVQASGLSDDKKFGALAVAEIDVNWYTIEGNHILFEAAKPIKGVFNWYAFGDHVEVWDGGKKLYPQTVAAGGIFLNVPFWPQTDNLFEPHRTCNTSSCAMAAKFLGANIKSDDEYYQIVRRYGDTTSHESQTAALNHIGIKSTWHTNLDFDDLDKSIIKGSPIVIAIYHRGTESAPTGGHVIVVIGKTKSGDYYVNDPYGSVYSNFTGPVSAGDGVIYTRRTLTARWLTHGPRTGWGRLFI